MRSKYGNNNVIASDVKMPPIKFQKEGPFEFCDVNDETRLEGIVKKEKVKKKTKIVFLVLNFKRLLGFFI